MPGQGTLSACGEGPAESLRLGWIRSALHYCTKHLGTQQLVTVLYNAGKQAVVRADAGAAGGWRAGKWWAGCGGGSQGLLLLVLMHIDNE